MSIPYANATSGDKARAVNSMLRDWVKGQLTAVECGLMSFEAVFMPHMLTADGRTLIERVVESKMLPAPSDEK